MSEVLGARRTLIVGLWLFGVSFILLLLSMDMRLGSYDEGIILTGGQLVASGAVPHRDFYANYGPGQFYILAGLFRLFGTSFIVARVYDVAVRAAIVSTTYWILARRCRPRTSIGVSIVCGLWMFGCGYYLYPIFPVMLFSLLGTSILLPIDGRPAGPGRLVIAGALTGLSALFRYDMGFLVLAAHLAALALLVRRSELLNRQAALDLLRQIGIYGVGTATTFLPPAIILLWLGAGPGFVHDIFRESAYYAPMRNLPFPGELALLSEPYTAAVYLPFLTIPFAIFATVRAPWSPKFETPLSASDKHFILFLGLLIAALLLKGLVLKQVIHMMPAIVPSTILFGFLAERTSASPPLWRVPLRLAVVWAVAPPILTALVLGILFVLAPANALLGYALGLDSADPDSFRPHTITARLPNVSGARTGAADLCAAELVSSLSRPDERILVATGRHDKIFINNVALYFAADRLPGTHWHHYDPGLQTRDDIQRRIIGDLGVANVRWVIRDSSNDDTLLPNASAISSGVKTLDLYLVQHYRPVAKFGADSVWLRKTDVAAIPAPSKACRNL